MGNSVCECACVCVRACVRACMNACGLGVRVFECIGMPSMYVLCFRSDREPSTYDVRNDMGNGDSVICGGSRLLRTVRKVDTSTANITEEEKQQSTVVIRSTSRICSSM